MSSFQRCLGRLRTGVDALPQTTWVVEHNGALRLVKGSLDVALVLTRQIDSAPASDDSVDKSIGQNPSALGRGVDLLVANTVCRRHARHGGEWQCSVHVGVADRSGGKDAAAWECHSGGWEDFCEAIETALGIVRAGKGRVEPKRGAMTGSKFENVHFWKTKK